MTTPATSKILSKKASAVSINASSTDYNITAVLFNNKGEGRFIDSNSLEGLVFETNYNTPFLMGNVTVVNDDNTDILNKIDLKSSISNINTYGDGQYFLKLKVVFTNKHNKDIVLLDKFFTIKNKVNTVQNNRRLTVYYFIDVIYNHLNYKRQEWNTDLLREKKNVSQYGDRKVNAGKALQHLLKQFCDQDDIIDDLDWDNGIGKLYYTLPAGQPALIGIREILKAYVSSDKSSGILTYYNGKFQLKSFKKHISQLYKKTNNKIDIGNGLAAIFKVETNDLQQQYTNSETIDLFGRSFQYIPINIKSIKLTDIQPDVTLTELSKNEIIQFNEKEKQFTIHSDEGTLSKVENITGLDNFPGGKNNKINIDENEKYNIKNKIFKKSHVDSVRYFGTIKLQKQLLNSLSKASFSTPANINFNANKFLYMTTDLRLKNEYANKLPGFWYITSNVTSLKKGQFTSSIECVKLDKPK
jgi:hypothetical protein